MSSLTSSRRRVLGVCGTVALGSLGGCSGLLGSSDPVFTDVSVDGEEMVVDLVDDPEASVINVFMPNGDQRERHMIQAGEKQVTFLLCAAPGEEEYVPGDYRIVAGKRTDVVQETTFELTEEMLPDC